MRTLTAIQHFLPLFEILADPKVPPVFQGLDVSDAQSRGRARALFLHETFGAYPSWQSASYSTYMIDPCGARQVNESPYAPGKFGVEAFNDYPKVKLTHSDDEIQFNLTLGDAWWARCSANLVEHGLSEMTVQMIRRPGPTS